MVAIKDIQVGDEVLYTSQWRASRKAEIEEIEETGFVISSVKNGRVWVIDPEGGEKEIAVARLTLLNREQN